MKTRISISTKVLIIILVIILFVSVGINVYQLQLNIKSSSQNKLFEKHLADVGQSNYALLSPTIAWLSVDAFLEKQQHLITSYSDLKTPLNSILQNAHGDYSIYFEDLTTGAWIGINEKEKFVPFSLLKIPTMVATLKELELGTVSLDQIISLNAEDIDTRSGVLWEKGAGYNLTIKELLIALIKHSDNTAVLTLNRRVISDETFIESRLAMGLPSPSMGEAQVSPKEYANILRGLYLSNYLRRPFSELGLTLMLETDFNSQIPAGVPKDVKIAHKVGFYVEKGYYHDCGIVYAKDNPYILCIMSKNTNSQEADRVISEVSKTVYNYVATKNKYAISNSSTAK